MNEEKRISKKKYGKQIITSKQQDILALLF
jgi:hypothetical protein